MQNCKAVAAKFALPRRRFGGKLLAKHGCGETAMQELGHFIDGKRVPGTSGRFADVYNPATGEVQARVPLASRRRARRRRRRRQGRAAGMGRHQPAAPGAGDDALRRAPQPRHGQARRGALPRARQDPARCQGRRDPRPRGGRVLHRRAASPQGRVHRRRRPRHRHVLHAPAARRRRRDHPVQLPRDDPDVEDVPRARLRQRLHPQALRARPLRAAHARRADAGGGPARRRAPGGQRRQGGGRRHPRPPRHRRHRLRRLHPDRRVHLCPRHRARQTRPVLRRRQEPHDRHARRRPRPGRRRARRRRLRRRRRALHGDLRRRPRGRGHRRRA